MNAWQLAWRRITGAARVILHDLFGEDDLKERDALLPGGPTAGSGLGLIQAHLDALGREADRLEERRRECESGRAVMAAELRALEEAIDRALLRGEDEEARRLGRSRLEKTRQLADLEQRGQEQARLAADARQALERTQKRADQIRRQMAELASREGEAQMIETLAAARREIDRDLAELEEELARRDGG